MNDNFWNGFEKRAEEKTPQFKKHDKLLHTLTGAITAGGVGSIYSALKNHDPLSSIGMMLGGLIAGGSGGLASSFVKDKDTKKHVGKHALTGALGGVLGSGLVLGLKDRNFNMKGYALPAAIMGATGGLGSALYHYLEDNIGDSDEQ